jgi:hypothetical protein
VAILLDNFVSASARIKSEREGELVEERRRLLDGLYPLHPLLSHLARVRSASAHPTELFMNGMEVVMCTTANVKSRSKSSQVKFITPTPLGSREWAE